MLTLTVVNWSTRRIKNIVLTKLSTNRILSKIYDVWVKDGYVQRMHLFGQHGEQHQYQYLMVIIMKIYFQLCTITADKLNTNHMNFFVQY